MQTVQINDEQQQRCYPPEVRASVKDDEGQRQQHHWDETAERNQLVEGSTVFFGLRPGRPKPLKALRGLDKKSSRVFLYIVQGGALYGLVAGHRIGNLAERCHGRNQILVYGSTLIGWAVA